MSQLLIVASEQGISDLQFDLMALLGNLQGDVDEITRHKYGSLPLVGFVFQKLDSSWIFHPE
jgi:hypothetical protein